MNNGRKDLWVAHVDGVWGVWYGNPVDKGSVVLVQCDSQADADKVRGRMSTFGYPLRKTQYARSPGECPCCGSDDIEGGSVDIGDACASQDVTCNDCSATWVDEYKLTGYSSLTNVEGYNIVA